MLWDSAVVKVVSLPDSRCIRVETPDEHVNCGFHEILLLDVGEEELPFVAMSELYYLRRIWPRALFVFMSRYHLGTGSGTHAEGVQGTVWLYTIWELYTLWQVYPAGFGKAHCLLPLGARAAVALSGYVVHGMEGDCSGLH